MFFSYPQDFKEREIAPGLVMKIVWGERITLAYATLQPNCGFPPHSHPHEQVSTVIEGELKLTIGSETRLCRKGDVFIVPGNVEHSGGAGDKLTIVVDTFSPPREDFM